MQVKETELRRMSVGIVAENKPLDTHIVEIIPIEALNLMDSELGTDTVTMKTSGIDVEGQPYKVEVDMGATLKAEWLGETNRITSPDVRRGEQVWVWRQGDADKYYWTSMGRDDDLRRLETVIYRFSGLPDNDDEAVSEDNSYYFEVSTHDKMITLRTSKRNGELTRYLVQVNPGDGHLTLKDDLGNIIQMDSARTNILLEDADKAKIELDQENIAIEAPGFIQMVGKGRVLVKSETRLILKGPTRTIVL